MVFQKKLIKQTNFIFAAIGIMVFILIYSKLGYMIYETEYPFDSCFSSVVGVPSGPDCCECPKIQAISEAIFFGFVATAPIFFLGFGFILLNIYYYLFELFTLNSKKNRQQKILSLVVYFSIIPLIIFFISLVMFGNPNYAFTRVPLEELNKLDLLYYLVWVLYSPLIWIYGSRFILSKWRIRR